MRFSVMAHSISENSVSALPTFLSFDSISHLSSSTYTRSYFFFASYFLCEFNNFFLLVVAIYLIYRKIQVFPLLCAFECWLFCNKATHSCNTFLSFSLFLFWLRFWLLYWIINSNTFIENSTCIPSVHFNMMQCLHFNPISFN